MTSARLPCWPVYRVHQECVFSLSVYPRSRRPVQRGPDSWRRLILAYLEDAPSSLDLVPSAPAGDECPSQSRVTEIDRQSVIQHAACPRWRHRPLIRPAILVEPAFDSVEPGAEPVRQQTGIECRTFDGPGAGIQDSVINRNTGQGEKPPWASWSRCVSVLFRRDASFWQPAGSAC